MSFWSLFHRKRLAAPPPAAPPTPEQIAADTRRAIRRQSDLYCSHLMRCIGIAAKMGRQYYTTDNIRDNRYGDHGYGSGGISDGAVRDACSRLTAGGFAVSTEGDHQMGTLTVRWDNLGALKPLPCSSYAEATAAPGEALADANVQF